MELLESDSARPRQARYQAALRPDMKCAKIIEHFPPELLHHLTIFAPQVKMSEETQGVGVCVALGDPLVLLH
jgi:hypothetical protein